MSEHKQLRPYQKDLLVNTVKSLKTAKVGVMSVLPPGGGKTLIMAEIARLFTTKGYRVLFTVHNHEILDQAKATFRDHGVDMSLIDLTMVQTLTRHLEEVRPPQLILTDEGHHSEAESYLRIYEAFPKALRSTFTATPWRGDGKGFDDVADKMVVGPNVKQLTDMGYLAPFKYYTVQLYDESDLKFSKRTGDYTRNSIEKASKKIDPKRIVQEYKNIGEDHQGLVYAATVAQSTEIAEAFNAEGIKAVHIGGNTDATLREQYLKDYRAGKIKIICNVQVFTEGVDLPDAYVCMIARPTNSLALFMQFSMRVLRPRENKVAKIIDFAGVANKLGLPDNDFAWTLRGHEVEGPGDEAAENVLNCKKCNATFESRKANYELDENTNGRTINVYCPECGNLLFVIDNKEFDKDNAEDELSKIADVVEISDFEKFKKNWLQQLELSVDQPLSLNAEAIKVKFPSFTDEQIFEYLIDHVLIVGNQVQLQINDLSEDEINKMYEVLDTPDNKKKFVDMFLDRIAKTVRVKPNDENIAEVQPTEQEIKNARYLDMNVMHEGNATMTMKNLGLKYLAHLERNANELGFSIESDRIKSATINEIESQLYQELSKFKKSKGLTTETIQLEQAFVDNVKRFKNELPKDLYDLLNARFLKRFEVENVSHEEVMTFSYVRLVKSRAKGTMGLEMTLTGMKNKEYKYFLWSVSGTDKITTMSANELALIGVEVKYGDAMSDVLKKVKTKVGRRLNVDIKKETNNKGQLVSKIMLRKTHI